MTVRKDTRRGREARIAQAINAFSAPVEVDQLLAVLNWRRPGRRPLRSPTGSSSLARAQPLANRDRAANHGKWHGSSRGIAQARAARRRQEHWSRLECHSHDNAQISFCRQAPPRDKVQGVTEIGKGFVHRPSDAIDPAQRLVHGKRVPRGEREVLREPIPLGGIRTSGEAWESGVGQTVTNGEIVSSQSFVGSSVGMARDGLESEHGIRIRGNPRHSDRDECSWRDEAYPWTVRR